ncbi:MAG: cytochrome c1 [Novosphingobium sp.]|nr:cytochrome c1 [Novosphingobium sp.]
MIRIFSILVGLFFTVALAWSFANGAYTAATEPTHETVEHAFHKTPKEVEFASDGALGKFDKQQLQRGFQVYKEVCSTCHSLHLVAFRNLKALGYSDDEVKAIASQAPKTATFDPKTGDRGERVSLPSDHFPPVYYAGQGSPPDLSLITKARHDGGPYVYSLLTGYAAQPADLLKRFPDAKTPDGLHYNPYFANLNLAMPPPLTSEGQITYGPGNPKATVDQMAKDVAAFLIWTAEPTLDKRKQTGWPVLGFLLFATILGYMAYRNVWAGTKH